MSYVKHTDKNLHAVVKWQSSKTELNIANTEKALRCLSPKESNGFICYDRSLRLLSVLEVLQRIKDIGKVII